MTKPLPKWIQKRYATLWNAFRYREFTLQEAQKSLKSKAGINVFFSELRKAGWMDVTLDKVDSRKRIYKLKSPEECFTQMEP